MLLLLFLFLLVCVCCVFGVLVRQYCSCSLLFVRVLWFPLIVVLEKTKSRKTETKTMIFVFFVFHCIKKTHQGQGTDLKPKTNHITQTTNKRQSTNNKDNNTIKNKASAQPTRTIIKKTNQQQGAHSNSKTKFKNNEQTEWPGASRNDCFIGQMGMSCAVSRMRQLEASATRSRTTNRKNEQQLL